MATAVSPFANMGVAFSAQQHGCDLVIAPKGSGRGSISIDTSPVSMLLLGFGSDRQARDDDTLPGNASGLLARRGWFGDAFLSDPIGVRLWLLQRGKHDEATRTAAANYAAETAAAIASAAGVTVDTSAAWLNATQLKIIAQVTGQTFAMPVTVA